MDWLENKINKTVGAGILATMLACGNVPGKNNGLSNQVQKVEKKQTEIRFDEEMYNAGALVSGEIVAFSFVFSNVGNAHLYIDSVVTACGCLHVFYPGEGIKPGDKGIIDVEFNSAGMVGNELKTIEVHANIKEPKHLTIFAEVENELFEINSKNL